MASNYYWIKLHHSYLDEQRVAFLSDRAFRCWILCNLCAGEKDKDGMLDNSEGLAWRLRLPLDQLIESLTELEDYKLMIKDESDVWILPNFAERQAAETDAGRQAQYRRRKRLEKARAGLDLDEDENDVDVTDPVTIRDADKKRRDREKAKRRTGGGPSPNNRPHTDYMDYLEDPYEVLEYLGE